MNASLLSRSALAVALLASATVMAQVPLADQPVFSSVNVPGNLALALSVEFPTAISVAHPSRSYSSANTYIGYFDPNKCYDYNYVSDTSDNNYFYPTALASNRTCTNQWSGNYLNWASMQTIDPFRSALTGGYRHIDTATLTVLEKAWGSNQGSTSNFPDSSIYGANITGATPYASGNELRTRIWSLGNKMRFTTNTAGFQNGATFNAEYFNNKTLTSPTAATRVEGFINYLVNSSWFPAGVNTTNVSARWTGSVVAPTAGDYAFKIRGDDGVKLTVTKADGTVFTTGLTGWKDQGATDYTLVVTAVTANETLGIVVEYYQGGGGAEVSLQWLKPADTVYSNVGGGGLNGLYGTATHYNPASGLTAGTVYEVFIRTKVCDASVSTTLLETNCTAYPSGAYKPTGLMQKYADRIRYSAFGYLNDGNIKRDGGVLRARQKFIGPTKPVPGGIPVTNDVAEWNANSGLFIQNPDDNNATSNLRDAAVTSTATGVTISNSGVMNYLNKFGEITKNTYKIYDPVGELYYAAQRYFRNLGNVPEWSDLSGVNTANRTTMLDGFPLITTWDDPVLYSCQKNFILGIGDVNTHADRNLPGNATTSSNEPTKPSSVSNDTAVDANDWTNKVGLLQGLGGSLGATMPYGGCCNNNGALMAGLAYHANVNDIRPDLTGTQTIQTYWLDVLEYGNFKSNNQFYLATKYGGFNVPSSFNVNTASAADFADAGTNKFWWSTTTDKTNDGKPRPDNYFTAARADQMVDGLTKAFSSIASKLKAFSTSFSTALPQVAALGTSSYSALFDAKSWTGELSASNTTFDANTGQPTLDVKWQFSSTLSAQAAGTGWDTGRNIVSYNTSTKVGVPFRLGNLSTAQQSALDTTYVSSDDRASFLNYVRGDRSSEVSGTGTNKFYRDRVNILGDIVGFKSRPIGPPAMPYSSGYNPGYDAFKTTYANRTPMVYVGANDGMVHAVDGNLSGTTAGKEVWAYVPGAVIAGPSGTPSVDGLAALGNPNFVHRYFVDATPTSIDVDFGNTVGGSGTNWRSILVGGLGKGGKTLYALDVTDPSLVTNEATAKNVVLWEFTDPDLGFTYGPPTIVKTAKYGWVVIAGSGYNNADGKGYIFFINPRTGDLLQKLAMPCTTCSASNQAGLAHLNAFVLDLTNGVADAVYAGDLMGNLWRVDVTGTATYQAPTKAFAQLIGSDGNTLPVTSRPLPIVQPLTNRRYVTVGTGRLLDSGDIANSQAQRFFAFIDGNNAVFDSDGSGSTPSTLPTGLSFPLTPSSLRELTTLDTPVKLDLNRERGWFLDLGTSVAGPGWRVLSDPTSFYGVVAFAATSPSSTNACEPSGTSRVYAIDLGDGVSTLTGTGTFSNGTTKPYFDGLTGVVIDLSFYSVNVNGVGTSRLIAGSNDASDPTKASVKVVGTKSPAALGLQRLNWREIPLN